MARYIAFAGAIPGMPELVAGPEGEHLVSGERLLAAAQLAGWREPIYCLLHATSSSDPGGGATPFSVKRAEAHGTEARMLTFATSLSPDDELAILTLFKHAPWPVGNGSWGWDAQSAAAVGEWMDWVDRSVRFAQKRHLLLIAINGRRPPAPT